MARQIHPFIARSGPSRTDCHARIAAQTLGVRRQTVIVDNRPVSGGTSPESARSRLPMLHFTVIAGAMP